ncbi:MAG: helix-turn-helix domain-containing protein [Alcanivoracaceae bacterium]|jgi:transcriptional regulator GlxA family with amidase domain|nr:helix-turn-helix domain-containing protein [Alcanivoracaceae bacterium]
MPNVAVFAIDDILATGVTGPLEAFNIANVQADVLGLPPEQRFTWTVVSVDGKPVRSSAGFMLPVAGNYNLASNADIIIIPGFNHRSGRDVSDFVANVPDGYLDWLRAQARRDRVLCGICSGSFVLAEAGLLDGYRATTSWWLTKAFRRRYPAVDLHPREVATEDGNRYCGGSASSWMHVCLRLVRRYMNDEVAQACARILLVDPDATQAPLLDAEHLTVNRDDVLERVIEHMRSHLDSDLPVSELAQLAAMSERNFVRRFRDTTGMPPGHYLQRMRLDTAKRLLADTDEHLEDIVHRVGYRDVSSFRRLFKKEVAVSPAQYRRRFRPGH